MGVAARLVHERHSLTLLVLKDDSRVFPVAGDLRVLKLPTRRELAVSSARYLSHACSQAMHRPLVDASAALPLK